MFRRIRLNKDERGISAVIVAVSLVGIFGAAMLSLDAGNMWQTRRNIVTATDATALQQAKVYAFQPGQAEGTTEKCPTDVGDSWTDYLLRNGGQGTTPIDCDVVWGVNGTGYVVVQGRKLSQTRLGGIVGVGDTQPYSMSASQWGFITEAEGLRPMGICSANDHFRQWIALQNKQITQAQYDAMNDAGEDVGGPDGADADVFFDAPADGVIDYPTYPSTTSVVHRIYFTKESPDDCGATAPGNWGWIDFNDTGNSTATLVNWILYGYQEPVGINDCDADYNPGPPAAGEQGDTCNGETGSGGNSVGNALQTLVTNETKFAIPIFDSAAATGNTAEFGMHAFVGVILRGYRVTGAQAQRYFDFEFVNLQTSGNCCTSTPQTVDTGLRGIKICDVDHDLSGLPPIQAAAAKCV